LIHIINQAFSIIETIPADTPARQVPLYVNAKPMATIVRLSSSLHGEEMMSAYLAHKLLLSGYNAAPDQRNFFLRRDGDELEPIGRRLRTIVNPLKKLLLLPGRLITSTVSSQHKITTKETFEPLTNQLTTEGLGRGKAMKLGGSTKSSLVFFKRLPPTDNEELVAFITALANHDITINEYRTALCKANKVDSLVDANCNAVVTGSTNSVLTNNSRVCSAGNSSESSNFSESHSISGLSSTSANNTQTESGADSDFQEKQVSSDEILEARRLAKELYAQTAKNESLQKQIDELNKITTSKLTPKVQIPAKKTPEIIILHQETNNQVSVASNSINIIANEPNSPLPDDISNQSMASIAKNAIMQQINEKSSLVLSTLNTSNTENLEITNSKKRAPSTASSTVSMADDLKESKKKALADEAYTRLLSGEIEEERLGMFLNFC
jgi:hypothetical protein